MIVNNDAFFEAVIAMLREGKNVTVPVKGDSMLPFIVGGADSVVLEGVENASPEGIPYRWAEAGDIVLFQTDSRFMIHRILRFDEADSAEIQGDGILKAKDVCPRNRIFGRVVTILKPDGGSVDVNSGCYRMKTRLWISLSPARRILLGLWKRMFLKRLARKGV